MAAGESCALGASHLPGIVLPSKGHRKWPYFCWTLPFRKETGHWKIMEHLSFMALMIIYGCSQFWADLSFYGWCVHLNRHLSIYRRFSTPGGNQSLQIFSAWKRTVFCRPRYLGPFVFVMGVFAMSRGIPMATMFLGGSFSGGRWERLAE